MKFSLSDGGYLELNDVQEVRSGWDRRNGLVDNASRHVKILIRNMTALQLNVVFDVASRQSVTEEVTEGEPSGVQAAD